jgi:hypothetical protein
MSSGYCFIASRYTGRIAGLHEQTLAVYVTIFPDVAVFTTKTVADAAVDIIVGARGEGTLLLVLLFES